MTSAVDNLVAELSDAVLTNAKSSAIVLGNAMTLARKPVERNLEHVDMPV